MEKNIKSNPLYCQACEVIHTCDNCDNTVDPFVCDHAHKEDWPYLACSQKCLSKLYCDQVGDFLSAHKEIEL